MDSKASARAQKKAATYASHTLADALIESIGDGMMIINEYGIITHVNQVGLDILGYEASSELIGEWLPKAVPVQDKHGKYMPLEERTALRAIITGKPAKDVVNYTRKNGLPVPVAATASPFMVENKPRGAVIVFRDITRELQIEQAKDDFISITSHQLRTPLTAIRLFSEMLANEKVGKLTPKQKEYASKINLSVERLITLVGHILNVSRIEMGNLRFDFKEVDLVELINTKIEEAQSLPKAKNVKIKFNLPEDKVILSTDPSFVSQILQNLIVNAVRYSPDKGGRVTVSLKTSPRYLQFCVADNGIGIPREDKDKVFERFFRAKNAAKIENDGTGLGLYLAKMIIEEMGGKIWFESKEGKGTKFYVKLPFKNPKKYISDFVN